MINQKFIDLYDPRQVRLSKMDFPDTPELHGSPLPVDQYPEGIPKTITGIDGNQIELKIFYPARSSPTDILPGMVYFHGGGLIECTLVDYDAIYKLYASHGIIVVGVDFRSAKVAPFPAALHDGLSSVTWTSDHAEELRIDRDRLIVGGESGGANLSLAVPLLAAQKNLNIIKGQFSHSSWLSFYQETDNRREYDETDKLKKIAEYYTPSTADPSNTRNPLAWPWNATDEQLRVLPPALLVANQHENLLGETEAYALRLLKVGVPAVSIRVNYTSHCSFLLHRYWPDHGGVIGGLVAGWASSLNIKPREY